MNQRRPLVAVIDSRPELLELFGEIIDYVGFNAVTFQRKGPIEDISLVISFLADSKPDILMFDVAPPYDENWWACERIHNLFTSLPLVVVTSNPMELRSLTQNIPILEKPFLEDELASALLGVLAGRT